MHYTDVIVLENITFTVHGITNEVGTNTSFISISDMITFSCLIIILVTVVTEPRSVQLCLCVYYDYFSGIL